jgi:hypothetical protein
MPRSIHWLIGSHARRYTLPSHKCHRRLGHVYRAESLGLAVAVILAAQTKTAERLHQTVAT